jgi:hypothetical protein
MSVCANFSAFAEGFAKVKQSLLGLANESDYFMDSSSPTETSSEADPDLIELFSSFDKGSPADSALSKLEESQLSAMRAFMNALQFTVDGASSDSARLQNLVVRLDYNLFYSKSTFSGFSNVDMNILNL